MLRTLCITATLLSSQVWADAVDSAKTALEQRLSKLESYQASFQQQVTDRDGTVLQSATGQLQLKKPNRLRWSLDAPNETLLIADGETVWHIDPFVEQVVAMNQSDAVKDNPLVLLAEPDGPHWDDFKVEQQDNQYQISSLTQTSHIKTLTLTFDGETLSKLTLHDRQQQISEFDFYDIQQNVLLEEGLFSYSLSKGYELDDQR